MSNFIVRVELYGTPSEAVYDKLHAAMSQKGFSRTFIDGNKTVQLPTATYAMFNKNDSTTQIVEFAKQAAATIWVDFAVLCTRTEVRFEYHNLRAPR